MNIEKMQQTQRELDERIIRDNNIKLSGYELLANTFVALDNELSEFANAAGWFKVWKKRHVIDREDLLNEYADCLHFFLSIANQRLWNDSLYLQEEAIEDLKETGFDGGLNGAYLELKIYLMKSIVEEPQPNYPFGYISDEYNFKQAWFLFIALGLIGFDFTPEQIEEAYYAKNKVNHQRQDGGY